MTILKNYVAVLEEIPLYQYCFEFVDILLGCPHTLLSISSSLAWHKILVKLFRKYSHFSLFLALLLSMVWEKGESYKLILNLTLVSLHGHDRHWWFGGGYYWKAWPDRILACNLGSDWHHIQPPPHHPAPPFGIIVPIMVSNRRKKLVAIHIFSFVWSWSDLYL